MVGCTQMRENHQYLMLSIGWLLVPTFSLKPPHAQQILQNIPHLISLHLTPPSPHLIYIIAPSTHIHLSSHPFFLSPTQPPFLSNSLKNTPLKPYLLSNKPSQIRQIVSRLLFLHGLFPNHSTTANEPEFRKARKSGRMTTFTVSFIAVFTVFGKGRLRDGG